MREGAAAQSARFFCVYALRGLLRLLPVCRCARFRLWWGNVPTLDGVEHIYNVAAMASQPLRALQTLSQSLLPPPAPLGTGC